MTVNNNINKVKIQKKVTYLMFSKHKTTQGVYRICCKNKKHSKEENIVC